MDILLNLIDTYGIYIIFGIIILEYSCFPLPSEVVLPLAGAIGYANRISPFIMILLSVIAGLTGSLVCYFLGYYGKTKIRRKSKKKDHEINESKSFYNRYGNIAISVGRIIPICRTYISFIAGAKKHHILSYIVFTTIGITVWNSCLILLGYLFYDSLDEIGIFYEKYKLFVLILIAIIILFIIIKKLLKKRKHA